MHIRLIIKGTVKEKETGSGAANLFVKLFDKGFLFDDLLRSAITNSNGAFEIVSEANDFRDFFDRKPELCLKIVSEDQKTEWVAKETLIWDSGKYKEFNIDIPERELRPFNPKPALTFIDRSSEDTDQPQVGIGLRVDIRGLKPSAVYTVKLFESENKTEIIKQQVMSNRHGKVDQVVILPQLGFDDPRATNSLPVEILLQNWNNKKITSAIYRGIKQVVKSSVTVKSHRMPLAVSTDRNGFLLNGFEAGDHPAILTLLNFQNPDDPVRVWMVPKRHEWRIGDQIKPLQLDSNENTHRDAATKTDVERVFVAEAAALGPGTYDFIIRRIRYGYEDDDDLYLREDDIVTYRHSRGLVVRSKFEQNALIRGGEINLIQTAARKSADDQKPYAQFSRTFQVGEDIWASLAPFAMNRHIGRMVAMYVIPHKNAEQWNQDSSLHHLDVLGGNNLVQRWLTRSGSVDTDLKLLWSNASQPGEYDIVANFGNNVADTAQFLPNGQFNMPLDMIDGYVIPGFRVVEDPTTDRSFIDTGIVSYDETTKGSVKVKDDDGKWWTVPLKAQIHFPSDIPGATSILNLSTKLADYPLIIVVVGNGADNGYLGYEYLLEHFAGNGFIAASIYLKFGQTCTDRALVLRKHIEIIFDIFGSRVKNNIGLMGHSRGGEAVVTAARLNYQQHWGYHINAVISLAPLNFYTREHFGDKWAKPYLVIYGSLDGDLAEIADTGFELYDNASGMEKSMMFVYRSCHDRYNTVWGSDDLHFGKLTHHDINRVLSAHSHRKIAMGYMSAFFRQHLKNETQFAGIFKGEWVPAAVDASDADMKIYAQYENPKALTIDNFEGPHSPVSWQVSAIGGDVITEYMPGSPIENDLRKLDANSPHQTAGLFVKWNNDIGKITYLIPPLHKNVTKFSTVSFRVTQRFKSKSNPKKQAQDLRLTLTDGSGKSRAALISKIADIPYPDVRGHRHLTKSAMRTIRIPLSVYTINCLDVDPVNLTDIVKLSFEFTQTPTGEIEIDGIQFTH